MTTRRDSSGTLRLLLVVGLLAVGCSRYAPALPGVPYRLGEQDGHLTMTLGQLTLVFEGIPADANATGKTGSIIVPTQPGATGGGSVEIGGVSIKYKEANRTSTVTVNNAVTFQLIEGGAKLVLGDKTYAVNEVQTVRVAKNGI